MVIMSTSKVLSCNLTPALRSSNRAMITGNEHLKGRGYKFPLQIHSSVPPKEIRAFSGRKNHEFTPNIARSPNIQVE
jgi:hypothetical protein